MADEIHHQISMDTLNRKSYRSDLSDEQWHFIQCFLPKDPQTGRPRATDREVSHGILYVRTTGCAWEDRPHAMAASYQTCHRRLLELQRRRVWQKIRAALRKEADRRTRLNGKNA